MAENFRNKQWFKNMSQEHKNEICKNFDIDEKTLRKAGRETNDGRIVIDLLRIDHLNYTPEFWIEYNNILKDKEVKLCIGSLEDQLENIKYFYKIYNNDTTFLKYKKSLHNELMIKQAVKHINHWVNKYNDKESDKEYCAYQIYTHAKSVLETDLKLIKS